MNPQSIALCGSLGATRIALTVLFKPRNHICQIIGLHVAHIERISALGREAPHGESRVVCF